MTDSDLSDFEIGVWTPSLSRAAIVAATRSWIGTPYRHQLSLKGQGCDCLGLVRGVWRELYGDEPERAPIYSADWGDVSGEELLLAAARRHLVENAPDQLLPGDVIVFRWRPTMPAKHCGVYVGSGRMVHAYQAAGKVAEGQLEHWERRIASAFAFPGAVGAG